MQAEGEAEREEVGRKKRATSFPPEDRELARIEYNSHTNLSFSIPKHIPFT